MAEIQSPAQQYLTFALGTEMFGIDIRGIKEIIEYGGLTTVPMMPGFIRGVINLRGAVVPVVDLSVRFGREPTVLGRRTCIVIIEVGDDRGWQDIGVVVDAVSEVLEIADAAIEPPPAFGACVRSEFIRGMALMAGGFTMLLDVGRVFDVGEMASITEAGLRADAAASMQDAA
jgi:purine-binding chemotaxis protein CheW